MVIAISFDSTIVHNDYPKISDFLPNSIEVINYLFERGHDIIIESTRDVEYEKQIMSFLKYYNVKFDRINQNSPRYIKKYNDSRKIYCDIRIDSTSFFTKRDIYLEGKEVVLDTLWRIIDDSMIYLEKPLVICIVGESGSGKSLIADYFAYEHGVNLIQSYTDRVKRENNESGHTFVSPRQMDKVLKRDVLAYTKYNKYRYCCLAEDLRPCNIYVITEDGLQMLQKKWSSELDIYSIRIHRDYDKRLKAVGEKRIKRDEGRYSLENKYFDYVIQNVTDDKNLVYQEIDDFVKKYRFSKRFEPYTTLIIDEDE